MEFRFQNLLVFTFVFVAVVLGSHAAPSSEGYWKEELPNIPMPKTIQDLLQSGGTGVSVGHQGVDVSAGKPGKRSTSVHVGKGGTSVNTGKKGNHASVYVGPGKNAPFVYRYAATKTQLEDNKDVALFFQEKDLKPGTQINLQLTKSTNKSPMLPRTVADSIPFSSSKITDVFHRFHIPPNSEEAETMKETVKECEAKGIDGEEKHCATSLESMLDYATSKLGKDVEVVTTYVEKESSKAQKYVLTGVRKVLGTKTMICHKMSYAYGVFYCHATSATKTYKVPLVGADGAKVKAAVVCHTDTAKWNPKHLAFQVLKVEPGTVPICHFLPEDHIVWVSK